MLLGAGEKRVREVIREACADPSDAWLDTVRETISTQFNDLNGSMDLSYVGDRPIHTVLTGFASFTDADASAQRAVTILKTCVELGMRTGVRCKVGFIHQFFARVPAPIRVKRAVLSWIKESGEDGAAPLEFQAPASGNVLDARATIGGKETDSALLLAAQSAAATNEVCDFILFLQLGVQADADAMDWISRSPGKHDIEEKIMKRGARDVLERCVELVALRDEAGSDLAAEARASDPNREKKPERVLPRRTRRRGRGADPDPASDVDDEQEQGNGADDAANDVGTGLVRPPPRKKLRQFFK